MNWKTLIPFVVAIALGVAAVTVGKKMLRKQSVGPAGPDLSRIVVAKRVLEPGYQLQASDLGFVDIPKQSMPQGAIANPGDIVNRVVAVRIEKGQTVVESAVAPRDAGLGLQALVPPGMRAVTVEVNEHSGMLGLIQPDCRVDVIVTLLDEESRRTIARTIVQNVKVLSVGAAPAMPGQKSMGDGTMTAPPKSVTLLCSIKEAEALELAATKARPRLVLRSGKDESAVRSAGISIGEVLGAAVRSSTEVMPQGDSAFAQMVKMMAQATTRPTTQPAAYVEVPRPQPVLRSVHIIKGGNESVKQFQLVPTVQDTAWTGTNVRE